MDKLILVPAAGLAMVLALLLGACKPVNDKGPGAKAANGTVCGYIHNAIGSKTLDDPSTKAAIELAAAKSGVTEDVRAAVDTYYRGDKALGERAMLSACNDAGYPIQPS